MLTHIRIKPIYLLSKNEFSQCSDLTFGGRGQMQSEFVYQKTIASAMIYMIVDSLSDKVIAWSMVFSRWNQEKYAYFFVDEAHRRKGHGSKLMRAILYRERLVSVVPFDTRSTSFFKSFGINQANEIQFK